MLLYADVMINGLGHDYLRQTLLMVTHRNHRFSVTTANLWNWLSDSVRMMKKMLLR